MKLAVITGILLIISLFLVGTIYADNTLIEEYKEPGLIPITHPRLSRMILKFF
ncbi:MAG: hypothetical protein GXY48_12730 [Methanomicrobiales archaeon]|nr:hypothetical protein [Methanomicrobiales archaeon]